MYIKGKLTLTDLRKFVVDTQDLASDTEVGIVDHYGDFHAMSILPEVEVNRDSYGRGEKKTRIVFERIDVGPEPD